ncbi:MAG: hypothetical protein Kow00108_11730 [Calditrichia bacterium]
MASVFRIEEKLIKHVLSFYHYSTLPLLNNKIILHFNSLELKQQSIFIPVSLQIPGVGKSITRYLIIKQLTVHQNLITGKITLGNDIGESLDGFIVNLILPAFKTYIQEHIPIDFNPAGFSLNYDDLAKKFKLPKLFIEDLIIDEKGINFIIQ